MKPDLFWPPAPRPSDHLDPDLKPDLTPARARAVARLKDFATAAEALVVKDEAPLGDDALVRSPEDLVLTLMRDHFARLQTSGVEVTLSLPDLAALRVVTGTGGEGLPLAKLRHIDGRLFVVWASQLADSPQVLLIDVKKKWGVSGLGPMPGDIAIFGGGHCGVVTLAMCRGCQHFESVEFTPRSAADEAPTIRKRTHWTSTLTHLVRLVFEAEEVPGS